MKRSSILLTLLVLALLSFSASSGSFATRTQKPIDPACVEFCRQQLFECLSAAQTNGEENRCISVYRSCTAHCR